MENKITQSPDNKKKVLLTEYEKNAQAEKDISLIHFTVRGFKDAIIDHDELFSIALVGYANALNTFDKSRGIKFSTYASICMKNEINGVLRKEKKIFDNTDSENKPKYSGDAGGELTLGQTIPAKLIGEDSIEGNLMLSEDSEFIWSTLNTLTDIEKEIITRRYGMGREAETQSNIAADLDMSQANISKIEQSILKKLYRRMKGKINVEDNSYYRNL